MRQLLQTILIAAGACALATIFAASLAIAVSTFAHAHGDGKKCHSHGMYTTHCH